MVTAFRGVQIPFDRLNIINRCWGVSASRQDHQRCASSLHQRSPGTSAFPRPCLQRAPVIVLRSKSLAEKLRMVIRMIVALRLIKRALISLLFSTAIWAYRPAAMQMTLTYFWVKRFFTPRVVPHVTGPVLSPTASPINPSRAFN